MILRHASVFAQLLDLILRDKFDALVRQHRAEARAKGFSSWDQFVAMLFCQLGQPPGDFRRGQRLGKDDHAKFAERLPKRVSSPARSC